jgi:membrane-associated phospholipid phosphatase
MGRLIRIVLRQRPADAVTIVFLVFLTALSTLFYKDIPKAPVLIILYVSLFLTQISIIKIRDRDKIFRFLHDLFFPALCVLIVFDSLEWLIHNVNPVDIDPILVRIDYMIFNCHPTIMLEQIMNPLLTDALQIAYTTYYFIPVSLGVILLLKRQREEFERSIFLILLCFYLSFLGYILMPALGPRFAIDHLQNHDLKGLFVAEPIQDFLNYLEGIKRDAFPSGHTAVALTVLYLAYRYRRYLFWVLVPIVTALVFSTVYCRYHYVVDVIAGFGLTLLTIILGEWYYGWWERRAKSFKF